MSLSVRSFPLSVRRVCYTIYKSGSLQGRSPPVSEPYTVRGGCTPGVGTAKEVNPTRED